MVLDTDVHYDIVIPFLRVLKPTVICKGIPVSPLWKLDHTEHGDIEKELVQISLQAIFYLFIWGFMSLSTWYR